MLPEIDVVTERDNVGEAVYDPERVCVTETVPVPDPLRDGVPDPVLLTVFVDTPVGIVGVTVDDIEVLTVRLPETETV